MFNWLKKKHDAKQSETALRGEASPAQSPPLPAEDPLLSEGRASKARGDSFLKEGRLDEAERYYRAALQANPTYGDALINLGFVLKEQGRLSDARAILVRAAEEVPDDADAQYVLAAVCLGLGDAAGASPHFEKAIALRPDFEVAYRDVTVALFQENRIDDAIGYCEQGLSLFPDSAELHFYRSNLFRHATMFEAALGSCRRALALQPDFLAARKSMSRLLVSTDRVEEAIESYRLEASLDPGNADPHHQAGMLLIRAERLQEANVQFREAVALAPERADLLEELGLVQHKVLQLDDAEATFRRAISLWPESSNYHYYLGAVLEDAERRKDAAASYQRAVDLDGRNVLARWSKVMVSLEAVSDSVESAALARQTFLDALSEFEAWFENSQIDGAGFVGKRRPFFLTYQAQSNVEWLRTYGALCAKAMQRWLEKEPRSEIQVHSGDRIRIGIVSADVSIHSVWLALTKGWVQHLDRKRFEIGIFSLLAMKDQESDWAKSNADFFEAGPKSLSEWVRTIRSFGPTILIYPAIGMEETSFQLASLRLAPTQLNAWGHPETSGLPTLDYYVSAELLEPVDAQREYSETLVRLPNLGTYYKKLEIQVHDAGLSELGIAADRPILICPGTHFKYQPDHDQVFVDIARLLPDAQFIFFRPKGEEGRLQSRLASAFSAQGLDLDQHARFLPWLSTNRFHGLVKVADVMLDTIGFSGWNTAIQAMELGLPIVAFDGEFMRGRLASGVLRRLDLTELIAPTKEQFVALVVKVVRDRPFREQVREKIAERRSWLFEDLSPIRKFEEFLESVGDPNRLPGENATQV